MMVDWRDQDKAVKMIVTLMHLKIILHDEMGNEEYKDFLRNAMMFGKTWGRYGDNA